MGYPWFFAPGCRIMLWNGGPAAGQDVKFPALSQRTRQGRGSLAFNLWKGWASPPTGAKLALMSGSGGSTLQKSFVPLPGQATAVYTSSGLAHYRHSDWLSNARLTSSTSQTYLSSIAYDPFGGTYAPSGTTDPSFTGENADTVSGDYDFLFREYSNVGRWVSPDPSGLAAVDPTTPQSWNRYAYVLNNPLALTDFLGLDCVYNGSYVNGAVDENSADSGIVTVTTGDCDNSTEANANAGYYVDCDGCLFDGNGQAYTPTLDPATGTLYFVDANGNGIPGTNIFGFADPTGLVTSITVTAGQDGSVSWWGAFASNLFSWKNFTDEFKQGGCVNVFGGATLDALNPFSPSLSSAGEATAAVLAASKYNAAVQYAASAPNYLGGTGLLYPMKSSVVRGMISDANATAAAGPLLAADLALAQGFGTEMHSMATGGCH